MGKNKVNVTIGGVNYTLVSEDEPEYIKKVAKFIDDKMSEIGAAHNCLNNSSKAILTAVNVADDFFKRNEKVRAVVNENEQLKLKIRELESRVARR